MSYTRTLIHLSSDSVQTLVIDPGLLSLIEGLFGRDRAQGHCSVIELHAVEDEPEMSSQIEGEESDDDDGSLVASAASSSLVSDEGDDDAIDAFLSSNAFRNKQALFVDERDDQDAQLLIVEPSNSMSSSSSSSSSVSSAPSRQPELSQQRSASPARNRPRTVRDDELDEIDAILRAADQ